MTTPPRRIEEMAREIRERLEDEWNIGSASAFCDESEWDSADDAEIEAKVRPILERLIREAAKVARHSGDCAAEGGCHHGFYGPEEAEEAILSHFGLEGGDE